MRRAIRSAVAVVALAACGASSSGGAAGGAPACASEDVVGSDGGCTRPGVPPDGCDPGFTYDGNGGCDPILPATECGEGEMAVPGDTECYAVGAAGDPPTCPSGQMALPGETACHGLADCGSAPWGNIPVAATTQYVDASYTGGASDGSAAQPWTTIGAAVTAATSGAIVAVAAGSYAESVTIEEKTVHLWGRCPSLVEIAGTGAGTVVLGVGTDGTEIHTIALTGAGVSVGTARQVVIDSVWVHDTTGDGVDIVGSATLRRSLVERATSHGILMDGATASIDACVVRDTAPEAGGSLGLGIEAEAGGSLTVTGAVVERNHDIQLGIIGSDATVDGCVVRDALPKQLDGTDGYGVVAQFYEHRAALTALASTFERNATGAILVEGSDAIVEDTLIRDTRSQASNGALGTGIDSQVDASSKQPARVTVRSSLVERSHTGGAFVSGSSLTLERCVVRDTLPQESDGTDGIGVQAQDDEGTRATLAIAGSLLERNSTTGLNVAGSDGVVEATLVRDTRPQPSGGVGGHGVVVIPGSTSARGSLTIGGSVVTRNQATGIGVYGADLTVDRCVVSSTKGTAWSGGLGLGVQADHSLPPGALRATLAVTRSLVTDCVGVGLGVGSADATVSQAWIRGVAPFASDGAFGDGVAVEDDGALTASSCRIEGGARAGLSMFATAQVTLASATLACDAIPLDGEDQSSFTNGGNLVCSCAGATTACQVVSSDLQPPPSLTAATP